MKKYLSISLLLFTISLNSCTNGKNKTPQTTLSPTEFEAKINEIPIPPLLDVRTPDEFSKGHIKNALNYDWNGNDFEKQIALLDKSKPVFVYCLSGGRSSSAASQMRSEGFKEVYELDGGMMKWRSANLPETTNNATVSTGMTKQQFEELINSDKLVLIDFYADWCAPCQKMKPYLDEISRDMANKVIIVRINSDENPALCKELKIDALPTLQVYKTKILSWSNTGFIKKEEVLKQLQ